MKLDNCVGNRVFSVPGLSHHSHNRHNKKIQNLAKKQVAYLKSLLIIFEICT